MTALTLIADGNEPKPSASFVVVTPEMAERWLTRNTKNRNIRKADLDRYKRDMIAGDWHLDGSPIRFGHDGTLLDGQHRLRAIVETGLSLPLLIVRGLDPDSQVVMDTGRRRTAADMLAINGHKNVTLASAAALIGITVDADQIHHRYEASHEEILNYIDANPGLEDSVEVAKAYARRTDCPPAVVAYTHYRLSQIHPHQATDFWRSAAEKTGLAAGDPVIALTNRFAEARRNRERTPRHVLLSLVYRAWNARRQGKTMRFIRVNSPAGGFVAIPEPK